MTKLDDFVKERDAALLSLNLGDIMLFYIKWGIDIPNNLDVFWVSVHKCILYLNSATIEQKRESVKWLKEKGVKPYIT